MTASDSRPDDLQPHSIDQPTTPVLPTPREMIAELDRYVIGQRRPKRDLAVAIYNHYLSVAYASQPGAQHADLGPQHILLLGPTGSGKTYLVRCVAKMLNVPVAFCSATALVEVGYKGESVDTLVRNLLSITGGDTFKAERGIIYIDEFDKIRRAQGDISRDVSGEGVQNALLTLLDGRRTALPETHHSSRTEVDVSKILFICTGAFSDLPRIVKRRASKASGFGFGKAFRASDDDSIKTDDDAYAEAVPEDLIEYGFVPEIIGRFSTITALKSLSTSELSQILMEGRDSILEKQKTLFALHGIELDVPSESIAAIAEKSNKLGLGARGLVRLLLRALDDVDWQLPELHEQGVIRIIITPETVRRTGEPVLIRTNDKEGGGSTPIGASPLPGSDPPKSPRGSEAKEDPPLRADILRAKALLPLSPSFTTSGGPGISDTTGWSDDRIGKRLETVRRVIGWDETTGSARKWWNAFENENRHRKALVLRLAEELANRKATITEFFLAYVYSNTDNIQANLFYLDYTRLKKEEERKKRERAASERPPKNKPEDEEDRKDVDLDTDDEDTDRKDER